MKCEIVSAEYPDRAGVTGEPLEEHNEKVGLVSLGCPKALVDSEHIATRLLDLGYEVEEGDESEVVVINTCGFIDAAKEESLSTIASVLSQGKKVVVTGCMGSAQHELRTAFPALEFISGPADLDPVVNAVQSYLPNQEAAILPGEARARLTADHFAYLKISEGCNHKCSFCIIPNMRGKLRSRALPDIIEEARRLIDDGVKEIALIAQDLSAYGLDRRYESVSIAGQSYRSDIQNLCELVGGLGAWLRLHYVYPYPHVDHLIPLMRDGLVLPYLDVPLQHASPRILKAMRRPAAAEKALERIRAWREVCPDLAIRSTFIVGFPGETDEDVGLLLDFLEEAQLDRAGCFTYSAVEGARANALAGHVDEQDKLDRQERVYELQSEISLQRLRRHVGKRLRVLVDGRTSDGLLGRSMYDAPDIDGLVYIRSTEAQNLVEGDFVWVDITESDDHDLYGDLVAQEIQLR